MNFHPGLNQPQLTNRHLSIHDFTIQYLYGNYVILEICMDMRWIMLLRRIVHPDNNTEKHCDCWHIQSFSTKIHIKHPKQESSELYKSLPLLCNIFFRRALKLQGLIQ